MSNRIIELEDTLKLALEALGKAIRYGSFHGADWAFNEIEEAINVIKEALMSQSDGAQPEHSATHGGPVAVVDLRNVNYVRWLDGSVFFEGTKLYTTPPPVPEANKLKPLTGKQVQDLFIDNMKSGSFDCKKFARAIEAAHNIKE